MRMIFVDPLETERLEAMNAHADFNGESERESSV